MSLRIDYDERAISQVAAFFDDPSGVSNVMDAIDLLADDPRPPESFPMGHLTYGDCESAGTGSCTR